jgi:hypothetical protein
MLDPELLMITWDLTYLWGISNVSRLARNAACRVVTGAGHVRGGIVPGVAGEGNGDEANDGDELHCCCVVYFCFEVFLSLRAV